MNKLNETWLLNSRGPSRHENSSQKNFETLIKLSHLLARHAALNFVRDTSLPTFDLRPPQTSHSATQKAAWVS